MGKYEDKLGEYEVLSPALGRCALGNLNRWRQIKQGAASQQEEKTSINPTTLLAYLLKVISSQLKMS